MKELKLSLSVLIFLLLSFTIAFGDVVFEDDFETDKGWQLVNTSSKGNWGRADPQGTTYQLNVTPGAGYYALVTDGRGGSDYYYDVDGGETAIQSPEITLPSSGDITISFYYYMGHRSDAENIDYFRVKIKTGSNETVILEELAGDGEDQPSSYESFSTNLNSFAGQTIRVLIEAADNSGTLVEASVDELKIECIGCGGGSIPQVYETPNYPSSYPNRVNETVTIGKDESWGGTGYEIRVIGESEANYDFLYLKQNGQNLCDPIHGNLGTEGIIVDVFNDDPVDVTFTSDRSVTREGFHVEAKVKDIRISYFNIAPEIANNDPIPSEFLERAKRNGYTHIMLELYAYEPYLAGSGTWVNGRYNNGNFHSGDLYDLIKECFEEIDDYGLRVIPKVQVGTPHAFWSHTGNTIADYYPQSCFDQSSSFQFVVPSIAPDSRPGGFGDTFQDAMEVIRAAFEDADLSYYKLDFISLGYSEAFIDWSATPLRTFYGTSTRDVAWMISNSGTLSDLIVASLQEKIEIINSNVGGALSQTRIVISADLFDPECWVKIMHSSNDMTDLPETARDAGLTDNVVFAQWWYHNDFLPHTGDVYNVENTFRHFISNSFKMMYYVNIANNNDVNHVVCGMTQLGKTVYTASLPEFRNNVLGGISAHWDSDGWDDDIGWFTMEFLSQMSYYFVPLFCD